MVAGEGQIYTVLYRALHPSIQAISAFYTVKKVIKIQ